MNKKMIYWHHPESCCVGYVTHESNFPQDGCCVEITERDYYRLRLHYSKANDSAKLKKIRKEQINGKEAMAYLGRAALFKLNNGSQVMIMCGSDDEIQCVIDQLSLAFGDSPVLDRKRVVDGALVPQNVLQFEDEL